MRLHLDSLLGTAVVLLGLQGPLALGADDPGAKPELVPVVENSPTPVNVQTDAIGQLAQVARRLSDAVVLVGDPEAGQGTAFVISKKHRLLATNAHLADIQQNCGCQMLAITNRAAESCKVEQVWYHPGLVRRLAGYMPVVSLDPRDGRVQTACADLAVLRLADGPELRVYNQHLGRLRLPEATARQEMAWMIADAKKYLDKTSSDPWAILYYFACVAGDREQGPAVVKLLTGLLGSGELTARQRAFAYRVRAAARQYEPEALADCNESIRLGPNDPAAYQTRARYWEVNGQPSGAAEDYQRYELLYRASVEAARARQVATAPGATAADLARATELALWACTVTNFGSADHLGALAIVYGAAGKHQEASALVGLALEHAADEDRQSMRQELSGLVAPEAPERLAALTGSSLGQ